MNPAKSSVILRLGGLSTYQVSATPTGQCRHLSSHQASSKPVQKKPTHWLRNLFPWKNPVDVAEMLQKNIIYEDENLLALNKPIDLPMHSLKYTENSMVTDPRLGDVSIQAALPLLKKSLKLERRLVPILSQHRTCSGVLIFAKTQTAVDFYARDFNINRTNKRKHQKYCAVTLGIPEEKQDLTVYMTKNHPNHQVKANLSLTRPSQNERRGPTSHGRIMTAMLDFQVLASSKTFSQVHVAAVEINTSASNWDLIPAYCTQSLSPILGEFDHASRIKMVMGKPILTKSYDDTDSLPPHHALLCNHLGISGKETWLTPTHLHCFEITLRDMKRPKQGQVLIQAPLPDYFSQTLAKLELLLPEDHTLSKIPEQGKVVQRNLHRLKKSTKEQNYPDADGDGYVKKDLNQGIDSRM